MTKPTLYLPAMTGKHDQDLKTLSARYEKLTGKKPTEPELAEATGHAVGSGGAEARVTKADGKRSWLSSVRTSGAERPREHFDVSTITQPVSHRRPLGSPPYDTDLVQKIRRQRSGPEPALVHCPAKYDLIHAL